MKRKRRFLESSKIVYLILVIIVFIELLAAIASVLFASSSDARDAGISNIFLAVLAIGLFSIPWLMESRFKFDIPNYLEIIVLIFLFAAIVLGNIHDLLVSLNGYDKFLHIVSGITISIIAFEIVNYWNLGKTGIPGIGPGAVALFAFCFSVALLVLWEFYEFMIDTLAYQFDSATLRNMQRYQWVSTSSIFPQDNGLVDTMLDLIVGSVGAAVVSAIGWRLLEVKRKKDMIGRSRT